MQKASIRDPQDLPFIILTDEHSVASPIFGVRPDIVTLSHEPFGGIPTDHNFVLARLTASELVVIQPFALSALGNRLIVSDLILTFLNFVVIVIGASEVVLLISRRAEISCGRQN